ncbi:MAG: cystathionine gamma-synthase [Thermoplasmatales archaeon B_DKE]|nr:MAG: cystathionine gamma-synthase [Thermoplasmatales archaeon B_DKE]QRF75074.1 putative aspartate aminotransferase 2 [Thermoplasmatales archaeon]
MRFSTGSIHKGEEVDLLNSAGDVIKPIHLSTTFAREFAESPTHGYEYTRTGNPTRAALESKIAFLENAKHGLAFSSGLAAETSLLLSLLKKGDHILASDDLYGGTRRIFENVLSKFGVSYGSVDFTALDNLKSVPSGTKLFWIETPSNPLLKIIDIEGVARIAHENGSLLVCDNTFATPYFQNPLKLGSDIILHSTTKYINGHSDSLGGAIAVSNDEIYNKLKYNQNAVGAVLSPFDSYLTMRGIKTLSVRMREHERNASAIVEFLSRRKEVDKIYYPGLKSHKNHDIAKKQMRGYGGIVSFSLNLTASQVRQFLKNLKYISLGESLGGVESLIEIPSLMTHAGIPKEIREGMGITDNLVRLSTGIEDVEDLIDDIDHALGKV